jgi:hypothetical protein
MIAMELSDAMDRVEELQSMNYDMLDYLRTQLAWLLEYCEKNRIPLPDFDKAILFFKKSGKILSDDRIQPAKNKPSDEEEYRAHFSNLYLFPG